MASLFLPHRRNGPASERRRSGFTLVEVLVVVGILGILSSLLFPVFTRARSAARGRQCMSNLRQIGIGFTIYGNEWDGRYPAAIDVPDYIDPTIWAGGHPIIGIEARDIVRDLRVQKRLLPVVMKNEITSPLVWQCPSDSGVNFINLSGQPKEGGSGDKTAFEAWGISYGYRTEIGLWDREQSEFREPARVNILWDMAGYWHERYQRVSQEKDVADKYRWFYHILWGDSHVSTASEHQFYDAWGIITGKTNPFR